MWHLHCGNISTSCQLYWNDIILLILTKLINKYNFIINKIDKSIKYAFSKCYKMALSINNCNKCVIKWNKGIRILWTFLWKENSNSVYWNSCILTTCTYALTICFSIGCASRWAGCAHVGGLSVSICSSLIIVLLHKHMHHLYPLQGQASITNCKDNKCV